MQSFEAMSFMQEFHGYRYSFKEETEGEEGSLKTPI